MSLEILNQQLNAEWNKPKAKNAKKGQPVRDYTRIEKLQEQINAAKAEINPEPNDSQPEDLNDMQLLAEQAEINEPIDENVANSIL